MNQDQTTKLDLECILTQHEIAERHAEIVRLIGDKSVREAEKKVIMAKLSADLKSIASQIEVYAEQTRTGKVQRTVDCAVVYDGSQQRVATIRKDTQEVVAVRDMTQDEIEATRGEVRFEPSREVSEKIRSYVRGVQLPLPALGSTMEEGGTYHVASDENHIKRASRDLDKSEAYLVVGQKGMAIWYTPIDGAPQIVAKWDADKNAWSKSLATSSNEAVETPPSWSDVDEPGNDSVSDDVDGSDFSLEGIRGVGSVAARALKKAGYGSLEAIKKAGLDDLSSVQGISSQVAATIKLYVETNYGSDKVFHDDVFQAAQ